MNPEKVLPQEEKYHISNDLLHIDDRTQVLNHCDTFGIFDRAGDIHSRGKKAHGIFHKGTRFLSKLELSLNSHKPLLLSSAIKEENDVLSVDLTNATDAACSLLENSLHISRAQVIQNGLYFEELTVTNFQNQPCKIDLNLNFDADFRDIFEVRGMNRLLQPEKATTTTSDGRIRFSYQGKDQIKRETEIIFSSNQYLKINQKSATLSLSLSPGRNYKLEYTIRFKSAEQFLNSAEPPASNFSEIKKNIKEVVLKNKSMFAQVSTDNEMFNRWINRSMTDLQCLLAQTTHGLYPYAGVPWYNTAFGRDGIITAMEVLWLAPAVARDALLFLADTQATELDPSTDAEPGKIIHEMRSGEMANTREVPFKQYYGTIDATPLFLMLAGMYHRWTGDKATIQRIWPNIKAAIGWINVYGDLDGDGFVEYQHKAANGLTNQGWKDSHDSIMYEDGRLCAPPIALCEVQGYVYAAKQYTAELARILGEMEYARTLEKEAKSLKNQFHEKFWDKELGCYILALDGEKAPCRVVSSNAGHCLFTGIADHESAVTLAQTLMSKEMYSGWGIRTLSTREVRYNPMSYHNGSIWPHDNALIAYGFSRYGLSDTVEQVIKGLYEASIFIEWQRLPELFCGFNKRPGEGPTAYPVACSPQAWSVGSVFLLLQACLGLEINSIQKSIVFNQPHLPESVDHMMLHKIELGDDYLGVALQRYQDDVVLQILHKPEGWTLLIKK